MAIEADHALRGTRDMALPRSRTPDGRIRDQGRASADDVSWRSAAHRVPWDNPTHADNWRNRAACRGRGDNLFFPVSGNLTAQVEKARAICRACPVQLPCRRYGLANEHYGIWGGIRLDGMQRRTRTRLLAETRQALEATA